MHVYLSSVYGLAGNLLRRMLRMNRRIFLAAGMAVVAGTVMPASALRLDEDTPLFNPCGKLSNDLRNHPLTLTAFDGLNPDNVWDCHVHLLGLGESGGGAWVTPKMQFWKSLKN